MMGGIFDLDMLLTDGFEKSYLGKSFGKTAHEGETDRRLADMLFGGCHENGALGAAGGRIG